MTIKFVQPGDMTMPPEPTVGTGCFSRWQEYSTLCADCGSLIHREAGYEQPGKPQYCRGCQDNIAIRNAQSREEQHTQWLLSVREFKSKKVLGKDSLGHSVRVGDSVARLLGDEYDLYEATSHYIDVDGRIFIVTDMERERGFYLDEVILCERKGQS
jgi:hypothetical protein